MIYFILTRSVLFALCYLLCAICSVRADAPVETEGARVAEIEYRIDRQPVTSTTEQLNILRNQTAVQVGDAFSRYAIQQSVKALYATQRYAQIEVYAQDRIDGVTLTYQLTPFARIEEITILGVADSELKLAIDEVLTSKPAGTYIPEIIKADISRIKWLCADYGYFGASVAVSDIASEVEPQESGSHRPSSVKLTYQITLGDASPINALQIQGNSAIATYRLEAACTFSQQHPVYNKSSVDTDVASMRAIYRENSYPTATIVPTFFRETGVLRFEVSEGKKVNFKFVADDGEVPLSLQDTFKADIVPLINTSTTAVWERRIKSYFKAAGYHDTTVDETVVDVAEVMLTINPGRQYVVSQVSFAGNRAFSDVELLREMTIKPVTGFISNLQARIAKGVFRREQRPLFFEQELDTDIHKLSLLYGRAGYPNAVIRTTLDKQKLEGQPLGEISIHIIIIEEHKEMIHRWDISGNWALDTATLLERLQDELPLPQPNTSLNRNAYQGAILKAYRELGYIDAVVLDTYMPETETSVFEIAGDFSASLTEGKLPLEVRNTFRKHNLGLEEVFVATNVGERWSLQGFDGTPRYTLIQRTTHLEVFEHGVLRFTVATEGEQVAFGKFYFEGDKDVVMQHVLEREVRHLEGTLWTPEKLSRAQQSLYSLGLFHGVQAYRIKAEQLTSKNEGEETLKTNAVLITVEKQEARTYSIRGGYSLAEGPRVTGELTDSNFLLKRNIRGRLSAGIGWRDELGYLLNATLTKPWLIRRTRGSLQVSARKLEIDDYVRALQGSFILSKRLSQSNYVDLRYSYRDLSQPVPPLVPAGQTAKLPEAWAPFQTTVSSLRFSWTYDSRVRYLNPIDGVYNAFTLEYAGGFLQGATGFIKTTTDTRYYQKLVGGLVLATALRVGVTTGLRSNRRAELISFERFWAGGSTTVRGYAERSLGPEDRTGIHRGDVQLIFNTELRFPIYSVLRGAAFLDTGNVWGSLEDVSASMRLPSSVGIGIYVDLGALTAGIDYAIPFGYAPATATNRRHFRLGSTF